MNIDIGNGRLRMEKDHAGNTVINIPWSVIFCAIGLAVLLVFA